jgi:SAM-dependent methyltransferase
VGQSYGSFELSNLLKAHLPVRPDWSVIEIGCAPGNNLVNLHRIFGYEPYGVEYSHSGVISTLETFCSHGFDAANVIEADFFDQEFHAKYAGSFDVVFSAGFIEHFDRPEEVLGLHVNLLKPDGYLICTIPNLLGLFYPFLRLCARDLLKAHNLEIMQRSMFARQFERLGLSVRFCNYFGGLQFYGSSLKREHNLRGLVAGALDHVQDGLDHSMFVLGVRHFPQCCLSSGLAFIGQRIS